MRAWKRGGDGRRTGTGLDVRQEKGGREEEGDRKREEEGRKGGEPKGDHARTFGKGGFAFPFFFGCFRERMDTDAKIQKPLMTDDLSRLSLALAFVLVQTSKK